MEPEELAWKRVMAAWKQNGSCAAAPTIARIAAAAPGMSHTLTHTDTDTLTHTDTHRHTHTHTNARTDTDAHTDTHTYISNHIYV